MPPYVHVPFWFDYMRARRGGGVRGVQTPPPLQNSNVHIFLNYIIKLPQNMPRDPRQTQKTIGPQSRNLYMLYIYPVSDSVTLHWINCHLNIGLGNKEKMGRAKNTIKTYGRHRQRVITADIWSSDDEKKTDTAGGLFSSSSSSLDSSAQNSTNDSLFGGPITTRRFWQQSKNLFDWVLQFYF